MKTLRFKSNTTNHLFNYEMENFDNTFFVTQNKKHIDRTIKKNKIKLNRSQNGNVKIIKHTNIGHVAIISINVHTKSPLQILFTDSFPLPYLNDIMFPDEIKKIIRDASNILNKDTMDELLN